ncbi:helix-turn-helix domain-containing protein [Nocardioides hwasunensis]|nr:helix-turn-helix domain-containing protein [Nocardioides hwasunensis]
MSPAHLFGMETTTSTTLSTTLSTLEPLLSIEELAEYLHVPVTTIRDWRTDGKGPCAIKVGGRVRYATSDVLAWLESQRESEPGHGPSGG